MALAAIMTLVSIRCMAVPVPSAVGALNANSSLFARLAERPPKNFSGQLATRPKSSSSASAQLRRLPITPT